MGHAEYNDIHFCNISHIIFLLFEFHQKIKNLTDLVHINIISQTLWGW